MRIPILAKKLRFTILLLIAPMLLLAQTDSSDTEDNIQFGYVNDAISQSEAQESIAPVDVLLQSNQITLQKHFAALYFCKATFLANKYDLKNYNATTDTIPFKTKVQEVLMYFDLAIKKADCINLAKYEHGKYLFLLSLVEEYKNDLNPNLITEYKAIKNQLKGKGLHPERFGFGVTGEYHIGREQWLGLGVSLMSQYIPKVIYKSNCDGEISKYYQEENAFGMNFLTFNYASSLTKRLNDFSVSLLEVYAPVRIVPTKFGFFKDPVSGTTSYYYRPGVGLSIGFISVSYSYNIMFKKGLRSTSEKSLVNIEINYPIYSWNEPRWKN